MLFMIVVVILGLVLDSIILYRKQEKGKAKAKASLLVLFIFSFYHIFNHYFYIFYTEIKNE